MPADDESHFYSSMAFSPDGALFITGEETGEIKGWLRPAMNLAFTWKVHAGYVNKLAFSADGKRLASAAVIEKGFEFDEIMLWEFDTGREIAQFTEHSRELLSLEFAADSTLLVTSDSFNIIVWNTLTYKKLWTESLCLSVRATEVSVNGKFIAAGYHTGRRSCGIRFLESRTGKLWTELAE